jgi:hypothetical protein
MWYVEYQIADGSGETYRYEGLTKEQAHAIHKKWSGWATTYVQSGQM